VTPPVERNASLERLFGLLEAHNPNIVELLTAQTEEAFVEATDGAIERAVRTIESGATQYSNLDERGLSQLLADFLNLAGYQATAERNNNGHVDVVVEHAFGRRWKYLGECKIHRGYQHHVDGCEQLLGYCTGRERRAFCMDFFDKVGAFEKMQKLRRDVDTRLPLAQKAPSVDHRIAGAFVTSHRHDSGSDVEILHVGCSVKKPAAVKLV
jgi:hypothetical protein